MGLDGAARRQPNSATRAVLGRVELRSAIFGALAAIVAYCIPSPVTGAAGLRRAPAGSL